MSAASRFTVGGVLEEQANDVSADQGADLPQMDHESAFEAGLALVLDGLTDRVAGRSRSAAR
jgi:TetR/AcrR family transcriptional regulator, tetracycline repressor protein